MIHLTINNIKVNAENKMTILDAAKSVGIHIPTLCHMKGLTPTGACRICVVEVEGQRGLIPSCAFPVYEGMVVETNSPRVRRARKTIVELLVETTRRIVWYVSEIKIANCRIYRNSTV